MNPVTFTGRCSSQVMEYMTCLKNRIDFNKIPDDIVDKVNV